MTIAVYEVLTAPHALPGTLGCASPSANPTSASFQMRIRVFPKMEVLGRGPAAGEANACGNGGCSGKEQSRPD